MHDLQRQLGELPHLITALRVFLGGSMKIVYESKVRSSKEPQAPMDVRVADLLDEIADVIDRVDGLRVADLIQQPPARFILWVRDVRRVRYLSGVDRALDIRRVHVKANKAIGLEKVKQKRHAPCPDCGLPTLFNWVGESTVFCSDGECGFVMPLDEYDGYCAELVGGVK